jgi:hypothetical protein
MFRTLTRDQAAERLGEARTAYGFVNGLAVEAIEVVHPGRT